MPSRKRSLAEATASAISPTVSEICLVDRIRNMWQFANLCQWIHIFGRAAKIDDEVDVEMLETECLKPGAPGLKDLGLQLLKFLSSHRGLTLSLFDEYARRQYLRKAPQLNPFGDGEVAASFSDFDVFLKIKVLQQLTVFAMIYSEKLREKTEEPDQTLWRIEPFGWDSDDRTYFLLDDNRLYRLTEPPPPPQPVVRPSKKTKAGRASLRKRRRTTDGSAITEEMADYGGDGDTSVVINAQNREPEDNGIGGHKWECVVVTLDQLTRFLESMRKTRDENEKILRKRLEESLLPILERQESSRKRKEQARERELLSLAKMATAKRSSRLASKAEQQRLEQQAQEEEAKRRAEEAAARKREAAALREQQRIAMDREHRLQSRHERLLEREVRRAQHEQDLAKLNDSERDSSAGRLSQRRLEAEIEMNKKALQELDELNDDWIFDCHCGVFGQVDDGSHSISCERCNTWQHSACLGISVQEAEASDFCYVCRLCRQREADDAAGKPRPVIKLKVKGSPGGQLGSEQGGKQQQNGGHSSPSASPTAPPSMTVELPASLATGSLDATLDSNQTTITTITTTAAAAATTTTNAAGDAENDAVDDPKLATPVNDTLKMRLFAQARRDSLCKNALFPPPAEHTDGLPVIPVKKASRLSMGTLPRPDFNDLSGGAHLQTPGPHTGSNPLSSSPPTKLAPVPHAASSPYHGPSKINAHASDANGLQTPMNPALTTPVASRNGSYHRGFPTSTPLGRNSPTVGPLGMEPLPPSQHGISPTKKRSPSTRSRSSPGTTINGGSNGVHDGSRFSPVVPPSTTLIPSPPPQINTPPCKQPFGVRS